MQVFGNGCLFDFDSFYVRYQLDIERRILLLEREQLVTFKGRDELIQDLDGVG